MAKLSALFLGLLANLHVLETSKILVIFPTLSKSHDIIGEGINRHLLEAGHEVTYLTPFVKKDVHPNLRQINATISIGGNIGQMADIKVIQKYLADPIFLYYISHTMSVKTFENENVHNFLRDPNENFDLVISDWGFSEVLYAGVAHLYKAPLIWVIPMEAHWLITRSIDEPLNPSYNSDFLSGSVAPFTFRQRLEELWTQIKVTVFSTLVFSRTEATEYSRLIAPHIEARGRKAPAPEDLRHTASMVLANSHVSFAPATALPQNFISVGGFYIDEKVKPLPENLQKIMDKAEHGVIYFSMGSMVLSKDLPEETRKNILEMFGTLQQTVIWKFEETWTDLPNNVHVVQWAPQHSILAHPNCVLFISHGGLLSTTETIHFGVPVVGIPVFADQFVNVEKAVLKGFAKKVSMEPTIDAGELKEAIMDVLTDPRYKNKVKELSFIYHDRPVKPSVELVHWAEHVIKTGGAPHLRSPALLVAWYQKFYVDLLALIIVAWFLAKVVLKRVWRIFFGRKADSKKKN